MKNTFGNSIALTLFGESHGELIGAVLDGLAPGIRVNEASIASCLSKRRPCGPLATGRVEPDPFRLVSGVYRGYTTGTPLCILIPNEAARSGDYEPFRNLPRPGHADFTGYCKYHGFEDPRGGGHFSGRLTAPLVAAGAILQDALKAKGIRIGTHLSRCAEASDRGFEQPEADLDYLETADFPVLDPAAAGAMREQIAAAAAEGDSVGGVLETLVLGLPAGVGEPWFDSLEGVLAHGLYSIPAVKGVEFGDGFGLAEKRGSEANDAFRPEGGRIVTATNHSGGINGGISNGMPLIFRCAVKPTPSIYKEQQTVNPVTGQPALLRLTGRHDPVIAPRARAVADAVTALVLADQLTLRFGTDYLGGQTHEYEL